VQLLYNHDTPPSTAHSYIGCRYWLEFIKCKPNSRPKCACIPLYQVNNHLLLVPPSGNWGCWFFTVTTSLIRPNTSFPHHFITHLQPDLLLCSLNWGSHSRWSRRPRWWAPKLAREGCKCQTVCFNALKKKGQRNWGCDEKDKKEFEEECRMKSRMPDGVLQCVEE
jgi:hypothetical protein